eukprot:jgi/Bigna1/139476/aug1.50_g14184
MAALPPPKVFAKRCRKIRKALGDRKVDINATGSPDNNKLISYTRCHSAVMGVGMFKVMLKGSTYYLQGTKANCIIYQKSFTCNFKENI